MNHIVESRKRAQKKSKAPARKTVSKQDLMALAGTIFADRGSPDLWVPDSLDEAVRLRILNNLNEGLVNIQPLFTLLLDGATQFAEAQQQRTLKLQTVTTKGKSSKKKRAKKSSDQRIASTTRKLSRVHKSIVKKRLALRKKK